MFGRGKLMFGGSSAVTTPDWPQPTPYVTDLAKAKALLAEPGTPGFETTLSFDLGFAVINEPLCVPGPGSLAQIGVKVTLNKIPGANWRSEFSKKTLPFLANAFGGWLNFPDYFFYWTYHGQNAIFNTMSYQNPAMDKLIDAARIETDPTKYREEVEGFIKIAFDEVPRIPVFQPSLDVAMQKNVTGYRYWFRQLITGNWLRRNRVRRRRYGRDGETASGLERSPRRRWRSGSRGPGGEPGGAWAGRGAAQARHLDALRGTHKGSRGPGKPPEADPRPTTPGTIRPCGC
jgi:peptide/nickel transport system substrate-binding protein